MLSYVVFAVLLSIFSSENALALNGNDDILSVKKTSQAFTRIAKTVMPTVVFVKVEYTIKVRRDGVPNPYNNPFDLYGEEFLERFFGLRPPHSMPKGDQKQIGQGSGFIISKDGYILTNHHVVGEADKITVVLQGGKEYDAKPIGTDPKSDVAIIKIEDAKDLPVLPLGDSDALEVGEWVMAIGNPFGLSHTMTVGIVSAKGRNAVGITDYEDFIQTDAAINPGNSGGPLINIDGEAIGINSAIFSRSGGYMGIGFAIPINMVKIIKDQLIDKGEVTRGYLGVVIQDLDADLIKSFGLAMETQGVLIADISEDSPAAKAGLKRGDVVLRFDSHDVVDVRQFRNLVGLTPPGKKVDLILIRNGKKQDFKLKMGSLNEEESKLASESDILNKLGINVQELTPDIARQFGYDKLEGALITEVESESPAQAAGIRPGMLILEVNRNSVKNTNELVKELENSRKTGKALFLLRDNKYSRYVMLHIE
ncbi:MAG: DegQ family serine endoprotease [Proteobacteria bacterium]|nr:DegQ family serine endoprotease [Pseudomonadota bacterium]